MAVRTYFSGHKGACDVEDQDQINTMSWFDCHYPEYETLCFHTMNESMMPVQGRVKAKRKGVKSGVSDIMILINRGEYSGLIIELKRECKQLSTPVSPKQRRFLKQADQQGFFCAVCYGFEEAKKCILEYLAIK